MNSPAPLLAAIFVATLLMAAALCGQAVDCGGCGHPCCSEAGAACTLRRLFLALISAIAVVVAALLSLRPSRPVQPETVAPLGLPHVTLVPLRI